MFLTEAEDPSLVVREKKKGLPRRLSETVSGPLSGPHYTTGVISVHTHQRALGSQALVRELGGI